MSFSFPEEQMGSSKSSTMSTQYHLSFPTNMDEIRAFLQKSEMVVFIVVYLSFLMDNVLLTVVVPIIPDYLFSYHEENTTKIDQVLGPKSLSPLQEKFRALEKENGPLGALLASKAFVQLIFTPLFGWLTEILGYNLPLLIGSCSMLLASILFAYGKSYGVLVFARALHGSSSAAISVSGMCLLAEIIPIEKRCKLMPIAFGGIALGVLIGYPLGGAAYQALGKSAPFLLIAFCILINISLQTLSHMRCLCKDNGSRGSITKWRKLTKDRKIMISTVAICVCTCSMAVLEPCVPMWLIAHLTPPPTRWQLGAVFIPDSLGYFLGSHFAGFLPMVSWRTGLCGMVLTGLSCCALPLSTSLKQLTVPHFGIGFGVGAVDATMVPFLANLVDTHENLHYGPMYALQQISVNLAYLLGPLIGGLAIQNIGFPWLIRMVGFLNLLFCPLLIELETLNERTEMESDELPSFKMLPKEEVD